MHARLTFLVKIAFSSVVITIAVLNTSCSSDAKREYEAISSYNKGVQAIKSENFELAGFYFRRAVIINPDFKEARLDLANAYFLNGNLDAAREEYVKLLTDKDKDPRLYFNLGWIYLTQDEYETSRQCFDNLKKSFPDFHDADYGLAMLANKSGDNETEKLYLKKYLESEPIGRWSEKAKQAISVIDGTSQPEQIKNTIDNSIENADEKNLSVEATTETPKTDNAIESGKKNPVESKEAKKTPKTEEKATKPEKKTEDKTKEKNNTLSAALSNGFKALEKGDLKKAEKYFKEASKANPKSSDASLGLAKVYFLNKKSSQAREEVKKTVKLKGGDPENNFEMGQELEKIGDLKSAMHEYRNYLAKNPFGENAEKAKQRLTMLDKSLGGES